MKNPQAFLDSLQVASPCEASWEGMAGDERRRFCESCRKHVYDLSALSAAEAVALIQSSEGSICGRLWRRADGTVITADCPVGARRLRARSLRRVAALPLFGAALLSAACTAPKGPAPVPQQRAQAQGAADPAHPVAAVGLLVYQPPPPIELGPGSTTVSSDAMQKLPH